MTKIMVIDDSNTVLTAAEAAFRDSGYEVITATDGFSAMSVIADHHPELIFVDIVMPRLDGYQACALIKRNHRFRDIPIVMLSSKDGLFDRARGRIVGAQAHINKPFSKTDLLDAARRYVGPAESRGDAASSEFADDENDWPDADGFELELSDSVQEG
ncbi:MAG: response regulator [Proteobacteria bacterium]|nr:MAG: response regulator [Pseudomonadota bacterium]